MGTQLSTDRQRSSGKSQENSASSTSGSETKRGSKPRLYGSSNSSRNSVEPGDFRFTMEEILKATNNFSPTLRIGQGGFGVVYKGCLKDGTVVAIKRAKKKLHDVQPREFQNEVRIMEQVEHIHLVRFYGYLEHGDERVIIVEYIPNGTLREHLDDKNGTTLDFFSRLQIAIDVAHAITYLHMYTDHPIIHRDIKSSNILLTNDLRAKVADFGFARLAADVNSGDTHVSTFAKGTTGYIDPEYFCTNQLTEKSDVYSFGALLVELVTGRRPVELKRDSKERNTPQWALKHFRRGEAIMVFDPRLQRSPANIFAFEKILKLAAHCIAPQRNDRPSMRKCGEILWNIRKEHMSFQA